MGLEKNARREIYEEYRENPDMGKEGLIKKIDRHYIYDKEKQIKQEKNRIANSIIAKCRDENNTREIFAYNNNKQTTYVNIGKSKDKKPMEDILISLTNKRNGLNRSISKIQSRLKVLENQVEIPELKKFLNG